MISAQHRIRQAILVAGDFATFESALLLMLLIRYGKLEWNLNTHALPFTLVIALWIIGFYIAGLYNLTLGREPLRLLRTYLEGMVANLAVAVAFFYLLPFFGIAPRTNLFYFFVISLLLGYGWRLCFSRLVDQRFSSGRVLFIGPAEDVLHLKTILSDSSLNLELVAALSTHGSQDPLAGIHWVESARVLPAYLTKGQITALVIGVQPNTVPELENALYHAITARITILDRAEIEEATTGRIPLSSVTQTWFLYHLNEAGKTWYETAKRVVDLLLAVPFVLLALLLYPLVALAIKANSRGPVLYSQTRVGKDGALIRIWKFRTMRTDAEKNGPQFTANAKTDPRLFPVGRLLRQTRIDELPQIWNVIRGDLSLIGPRPERPEFVAPLVERMPFYALRHLTRPGLTGWAQVQFLKANATLDDNLTKLQYDLFYIRHRSLLLDLAILLKTIGIVLRRQGT